MISKDQFSSIILWTARILAILEIGFILIFMLSDLLGNTESGGEGLKTLTDIATFICFPVFTVLGLLIAFKWEGWGGFISTIGFIGLSIFRTDLISDPKMIALAIPGILFLLYRILKKRIVNS